MRGLATYVGKTRRSKGVSVIAQCSHEWSKGHILAMLHGTTGLQRMQAASPRLTSLSFAGFHGVRRRRR